MQNQDFQPGVCVKRTKGTWNLMIAGQTAVVDGVKPYNNSIVLHLKGERPETFHSSRNFIVVESNSNPKVK